MALSAQSVDRRRLRLLVVAGLALLGIGCVFRLITTDTVSQWKARRLSDEALADVAKQTNAPFPYIFEWAKRLEAGGRLLEAERVYVRAMELTPTNAEPWIGVGRTAFAVRDWGRASAVLAKTVEQWPDNAQAHFDFAAVLGSTFRVRMAIAQLQAGIKLEPGKGEAYATLGDLEMREGNPAAAVDAYAKALTLIPSAKRLQSHYGAALVGVGQYARAQTALAAALKADPSDINARFDLGKALANDGKSEDRTRAMQELNRVVLFSENKSRAYLEAAHIWLREKERSNGIQALEHAYDFNPYNLEVLKLLVQTCEDDGRHAEAQRFRAALDQTQRLSDEHNRIVARLEADDNLVDNLMQLGHTDMNAHNFVEAQAAFEAASYVAPGNAEAARELKTAIEKYHGK